MVKDSSGAWKLNVKPLAAKGGVFRIPLDDAEHCSELVDFAVLGFFGAVVEVSESQAVFQHLALSEGDVPAWTATIQLMAGADKLGEPVEMPLAEVWSQLDHVSTLWHFATVRCFQGVFGTRAHASPPRLCRGSEMVRALTRGTNGMWGVGWDRSGAIPGLRGVSQSRTCRLCCRQLSGAFGARTGLDGARWRTRPPSGL